MNPSRSPRNDESSSSPDNDNDNNNINTKKRYQNIINNNNNKNGDDNTMNEFDQQRKTIEPYVQILTQKLSNNDNIRRMDQLYNSDLYREEKKILTSMNNNGLVYGLAAGIGTFLCLRMGPVFFARRMARRDHYYGSNNNPFSNGGSKSNNNPFPSPSEMPPPPKQPGLFLRITRFGLNLMASSMVAIYASTLSINREKLIKDISELPLVEGRSIVSDEFCHDFVKQYRSSAESRRLMDLYHAQKREGNGSDALMTLRGFVYNCERRRIMEERIREEQKSFGGGFGIVEEEQEEEDGHVPIPSPGVPRDIDVVFDDDDDDDDDEKEGGGDERYDRSDVDSTTFGDDKNGW